MALASLIAAPDGDARLVFNAVHPATLWKLIERDGPSVVADVLLEVSNGWSTLDPDQTGDGHDLRASDDRLTAHAGYGVLHAGLAPVTDWATHDLRDVQAVFVFDDTRLRIVASALSLSVPYADPSPNWSQFDHAFHGGPPPFLQLVDVQPHPSRPLTNERR